MSVNSETMRQDERDVSFLTALHDGWRVGARRRQIDAVGRAVDLDLPLRRAAHRADQSRRGPGTSASASVPCRPDTFVVPFVDEPAAGLQKPPAPHRIVGCTELRGIVLRQDILNCGHQMPIERDRWEDKVVEFPTGLAVNWHILKGMQVAAGAGTGARRIDDGSSACPQANADGVLQGARRVVVCRASTCALATSPRSISSICSASTCASTHLPTTSTTSSRWGFAWMRALESGGYEQRVRLRGVGDWSLFMSGFFSDSFARRSVDIDYYRGLGERAYASLSRVGRRGVRRSLWRVVAQVRRLHGRARRHQRPHEPGLGDRSDAAVREVAAHGQRTRRPAARGAGHPSESLHRPPIHPVDRR